jgi:hypothetical protein
MSAPAAAAGRFLAWLPSGGLRLVCFHFLLLLVSSSFFVEVLVFVDFMLVASAQNVTRAFWPMNLHYLVK